MAQNKSNACKLSLERQLNSPKLYRTLSKGYSQKLLKQLNEFRKNGQFTDVVLICENARILAHRNILAAASPYFMAMFSGNFPESHQPEIKFEEMDAQCLRMAIEFIYTSQLDLTDECVQQVLQTATFLQLEHLADLCAEYMTNLLDAENCLGFKQFAEKQNNYLLLECAKDYIIGHFLEVLQCEEFFEMTYEELAAILSLDQLFMHSDDKVLKGLVRWADYRPEERFHCLGKLLNFIHPACVSATAARSLTSLRQEPSCSQWLSEVECCEDSRVPRIFVLDKMGRRCDAFRFDAEFAKCTPIKTPPRVGFALSLSAHKNILYIQGGSVGNHSSIRDSYYYNIYRDQWYDLTPLLVDRSHHRSLIAHDCLYALGGHTAQVCTDTVECLNLITNKATHSSCMREKRSSMGAVALESVLYVMGGENDVRSLRTAERYDPREGRWKDLPPMREVNSFCCSAAIANNIYCCEGLGTCMERFDIRSQRWEVINFWEEREFHEIFTVGSKLYGTSSEAILRYDWDTSRWLNAYEFGYLRDWDTAVAVDMSDCNR
uniref:Kelch-like protein diablo n=1 Tax=Glossina morsitans morsitans TaxID=37546 RepID=A0A1B0FDA9_GLOMM